MRSINAVSITHNVLSWLAETRRPRILHVFEPACNLVNERGEVLSIVTPRIGNGPFNLVVAGQQFSFPADITIDSPVSIQQDQLRIGNVEISWRGAENWSPRPDWETLHSRRDEVLGRIADGCGDFERIPVWRSVIESRKHPVRPDQLMQTSAARELVAAMLSVDLAACRDAARRLAGLGAGLTPAGDDFLLGAILAARIVHRQEIARLVTNTVVSTAAPLTTTLSAAWLRSAGKGEAGVLWHDLLSALLSPDATDLQVAVQALLATGHTSGADALAGFNRLLLAKVYSLPSAEVSPTV